MEVEETCSCGASFRASGDQAARLWREWQKGHVCEPKPADQNETVVMTASDTKTDISLGFAPAEHPGRRDTGLDE